MADLLDAHDRALDHTSGYIAAIGRDQWGLDTPCDGWVLRFLVNHVVSGNFWAGELVRGKTIDEVGDRLDGDILGDDAAAVDRASAEAASSAFCEPGALVRPCAVSYGPIPGSEYLAHRYIDVLIHGWDVAMSIGSDPILPDDLVGACWEVVEPMQDMLSSTGAFGDGSVVAGDGAALQTRLLAALGREG